MWTQNRHIAKTSLYKPSVRFVPATREDVAGVASNHGDEVLVCESVAQLFARKFGYLHFSQNVLGTGRSPV